METNRRIASGRLAEVFGPSALETDRFLRTLGIRRVAQANLQRLDPSAQALMFAYAAGVNTLIDARRVLPLEFWITGVAPEPWTAVDSAAWAKMMAWELGGNWRSELLRLQMAKRLSTAAIQQFLPPYPGDAPVELPDLRQFYGEFEREAPQLSLLIEDGTAGLGSNNSAPAGTRTKRGQPPPPHNPPPCPPRTPAWYVAAPHTPPC